MPEEFTSQSADDLSSLVDAVVTTNDRAPMSPREAANSLAQHRYKRDAQAGREAAQPAEPAEIPAQPEAAAPETDPGEQQTTETTAEPEATPPIEPPRSWTKEEKEEFASYPREAQEKIARREQDRESALRRGQNDTAEQRKAIEAERAQLEQARKQYEEALPVLISTLQQQMQGEFADIKTPADIEKMAREDWPRYALWDAKQKQIGHTQQELAKHQAQQAQEYQSKWSEFAKTEDAKFVERAPEMANKETATKIANASVDLLRDLGFSEQDLGKLWNGEASLSLRDHRAQLLIRDAVKFREAQAAIKRAAPKPVPQVQRPGTAQQRAPDSETRIRNLEQQLERTGNWKDAAALMTARRAAARQ